MKKYTRSIMWWVSDPHSWFKLGMLNPETIITDPSTKVKQGVNLNSWQQFLWETFAWGKDEVVKLAGKDPVHGGSVGDITHGNKYISEQMSTQVSAQIEAAYYNFLPMLSLKNMKSFRFSIGTAAHGFGEGSSDVITANMLRLKFPDIDIKLAYHGTVKVDNVLVDYAHHGPGPGTQNWTRGDAARRYAKSMLMDDVCRSRPTPQLILRGHYHEYVREWASYMGYAAWMIVMPPMCFPGDYTHQAIRSQYYITPGTVAVEIVDGKIVEIYPFIKCFDTRMPE